MRQTKLSVVFIKIASMVGVALCVVPFFTSVQAQTSNGQTQMLLEMQALRQEVAELRDMVERQQFELRKLQRQLQSKQLSKGAPSVSNGPQVIQLNSEPLIGTPVDQPIEVESGLVNANEIASEQGNTAGLGFQSGIEPDSAQVAEASASTNVGESSGGREYPPVVEISIGGSSSSANRLNQASVDSGVVIEPSPLPESVIDAQGVSAEGNLLADGSTIADGSLLAGGSRVIVEQAGESALAEIKPIETVSAQPVVAVPNAPDVTASQPSVPSATKQVAALDPSSVVDVVSENDYYQRGFALLKESKHTDAVAVFKQQIASYPKGERADDAYYWIAESMYVNRKLDVSKENFKAIIQGYPNSARLPDAMLKLAYIEQEQGNIIEARILLQEILQFHPKSDAALSAKKRLAEIK